MGKRTTIPPHAPNRDAVKRSTGAYQKFAVARTDGGHKKGCKHFGCQYFVIDVTHDKFAPAALKAYAKACAKDYPQLSKDLLMAATTRVMDLSPTPIALLVPSPKG